MNRLVPVCLSVAALAQVDYQPAEAYRIDGYGRPFPGLVLTLSADKTVFKRLCLPPRILEKWPDFEGGQISAT